MNSEFFEACFAQQLILLLNKDTVIIIDNTSFHRKNNLSSITQKYGIKIIFLPSYSPELSPIEHFWHWLKKMTAICCKNS